jgi:hypothetical protein
LGALFVLSAIALSATSVEEVPLAAQIGEAALVVVGRVTEVKMKGWLGLPVFDDDAETGPGSRYSLWLTVEFDRSAVLKGNPSKVPLKKNLPIWTGWIKDLESESAMSLGKSFIFFLSEDLDPASVHFQHLDFEKADIEEVIRKQKPESNPESLDDAVPSS